MKQIGTTSFHPDNPPMKIFPFLRVGYLCILILFFVFLHLANAQTTSLKPRLTIVDESAVASMDILKGAPETVTMRSGYVVLAPGQSVGKHSTKGYEEVVIALKGSGEMRTTNGDTLRIKPYTLSYCPPMTEHDVVNTGTDSLRYIWLVARAPLTEKSGK
jgi:quercetin dioxygenase-like cupin family protein